MLCYGLWVSPLLANDIIDNVLAVVMLGLTLHFINEVTLNLFLRRGCYEIHYLLSNWLIYD